MNNLFVESCPELSKTKRANKRLIDTGLLHHEASLAGNSERYRRGETSHTIHVWWARRPHVAMRSLIYATVCKSLSKTSIDLMNNLSLSYNDDKIIEKARKATSKYRDEIPKVLDMFGGGGTIPYEVLNLGLDSYSIDSNELSIFIQKANLQYLNDIDVDELTNILEVSGKRVLDRLRRLTAPIFPNRNRKDGKETTNYLWTYTYNCEKCDETFSLSKRYWLSRKKGKNLFLKVKEIPKRGPKLSIESGEEVPEQTNWVKRLNKVKCPHCHHLTTRISIKKAKELLAVEVVKEKTGKSFLIGQQLDRKTIKNIKDLEKKSLKALKAKLPKSKLPKWSGIVNSSFVWS